MPRFIKHKNSTTLYDNITVFNKIKNQQIPQIKQITLNVSDLKLITTPNKILDYLFLLELFTNDKPEQTRSTMNKIQIKLKKNTVIGCAVRIRAKAHYNFLEFLILYIFPQQIKFKGFRNASKKLPIYTFHLRDWVNIIPFNTTLKNVHEILNLGQHNYGSLQITIEMKSESFLESNFFLNSYNYPV